MKIVAIVQGRMSSQRLPGKILKLIQGKPMIEYVLESALAAEKIDSVVLATSSESSDDPVAEFAIEKKFPVSRGPLGDVADRFLAAAEQVGAEVIVRISGDSPLIDPRVIDRGVEVFGSANCPLVTNVRPRTFPPGCSVEVFSVEALQMVHPTMTQEEREHVTPAIYRGKFRNFEHSSDLSGCPLTVDTAEDFDVVSRVVAEMSRRHTEYTIDETVAIRNRVVA